MWDLVPGPGIETRSPELEAQSLSHWTSREVPGPLAFGEYYQRPPCLHPYQQCTRELISPSPCPHSVIQCNDLRQVDRWKTRAHHSFHLHFSYKWGWELSSGQVLIWRTEKTCAAKKGFTVKGRGGGGQGQRKGESAKWAGVAEGGRRPRRGVSGVPRNSRELCSLCWIRHSLGREEGRSDGSWGRGLWGVDVCKGRGQPRKPLPLPLPTHLDTTRPLMTWERK